MPVSVCFSLVAAAVASQADVPIDDAPSGEIIVTGERVPRTLRDTPSSVAVVNESEIEAAGANRVDDILALIPNVQLGNGKRHSRWSDDRLRFRSYGRPWRAGPVLRNSVEHGRAVRFRDPPCRP
jgi:outer membrane receptor for ferrienterochelin and colicin